MIYIFPIVMLSSVKKISRKEKSSKGDPYTNMF
jgi:hypothetical protein